MLPKARYEEQALQTTWQCSIVLSLRPCRDFLIPVQDRAECFHREIFCFVNRLFPNHPGAFSGLKNKGTSNYELARTPHVVTVMPLIQSRFSHCAYLNAHTSVPPYLRQCCQLFVSIEYADWSYVCVDGDVVLTPAQASRATACITLDKTGIYFGGLKKIELLPVTRSTDR